MVSNNDKTSLSKIQREAIKAFQNHYFLLDGNRTTIVKSKFSNSRFEYNMVLNKNTIMIVVSEYSELFRTFDVTKKVYVEVGNGILKKAKAHNAIHYKG